MRPLLLLTFVLSLFYLNTAIVKGLGGPGEKLVIEPFHGVYPIYGGGEENSWIRKHPGEEVPWWHHPKRDHGATLISSSSETTAATWTLVYGLGYSVWILSLVCSLTYSIYRIAKFKGFVGRSTP